MPQRGGGSSHNSQLPSSPLLAAGAGARTMTCLRFAGAGCQSTGRARTRVRACVRAAVARRAAIVAVGFLLISDNNVADPVTR